MVHKSTILQSGTPGEGTVTEVDTGTGLTGGPITGTGTISVANSINHNSLAGYNNTGVFGSVLVGSGLSLSSGTITASGSAPTFDTIGSGTNTAAAMVVGSGASLGVTSSGTISATAVPASGITGTTLASGVTASSLTSVGTLGSLTVTGNITNSTLTASQIVATDGSKNLQTLATATYPSLTELSYVKGVTSAIQTQINAKGAGTVTAVSIASANGFSGSSSGGATPALTIVAGAIVPTSVNKVTITAPASAATLTIDDGVTLTAPATTNVLVISGTSALTVGTSPPGSPASGDLWVDTN